MNISMVDRSTFPSWKNSSLSRAKRYPIFPLTKRSQAPYLLMMAMMKE